MSKTVLLEVKNSIGYITINRPEALNALSSQVLTDLNDVLDQVEQSEEIRVVIVTGAGEKAFVAGADIKEMDVMSPIQAFEYMTFANNTFTRLSDLRQPTIAVLNGYALGGGMELALSTDIRIGLKEKFAQNEDLKRQLLAFQKLAWALFRDSLVLNVCLV